ncbi:MAG TPA: YggS family pyridoxal phosphate-dependent enzyme [Microscillaceae bacterium]|jgi:pyridoxal phosphate enzyme (YggS family)|nr:YggS family pyridoxal phosphate-dependent enzyme [Microscillaceae bacterium]
MSAIKENFLTLSQKIERLSNPQRPCQLIAVSKTYPSEALMEAYEAGARHFGENKVQEMCSKQAQMPADVAWHLIGHLQTNKVKYIAPFVHTIHSVDSWKLLQEIDKQAAKNQRIIRCLLQIYIAQEETKFGLSQEEALAILQNPALAQLANIQIVGLMGMATNTSNETQIRAEFQTLKQFFDRLGAMQFPKQVTLTEISMGMSSDYALAIGEGSTIVRVGSAIFGQRS